MVTAVLLIVVVVVREEGDVDDGSPMSASTTPAEELDGCEVVTRDDAQRILGAVPQRGAKSTEQFTAANCTWEFIPRGGARSLQFSAYRGHELYGAEMLRNDPTYEEVHGIGAGAFSIETDATVQLRLRAGDFTVLLSVNGLDAGPPLDKKAVKRQLVDLGKRVASKLS